MRDHLRFALLRLRDAEREQGSSVALAGLVLFVLFLISHWSFLVLPCDVRYVIPAYMLLILSIERAGTGCRSALAVD